MIGRTGEGKTKKSPLTVLLLQVGRGKGRCAGREKGGGRRGGEPGELGLRRNYQPQSRH